MPTRVPLNARLHICRGRTPAETIALSSKRGGTMHNDPMAPPPVARALEEYRALLAEHGLTWGEPPVSYVRLMPFLRFPEEARRMAAPDGPDELGEAFRQALDGGLPSGLTALRLSALGHRLEAAHESAVLSA